MVFNATFKNISVILWQSALLVEETGENHRPVTSYWQTLSHNVVHLTQLPYDCGHNGLINRWCLQIIECKDSNYTLYKNPGFWLFNSRCIFRVFSYLGVISFIFTAAGVFAWGFNFFTLACIKPPNSFGIFLLYLYT